MVCEVHEVGPAAAGAGPLAVAALPEPDPRDHPGFLTAPAVTVALTGLAPGARLRLRSRCVAGGDGWRWELSWSEATVAATLRHTRHPAAEHPPEVVRVMGTHVTLRVRNPGAPGACLQGGGAQGARTCWRACVCEDVLFALRGWRTV